MYKNIAVIGVGSFFWNAHYFVLKNLGLIPKIIIDIESQQKTIEELLKSTPWSNEVKRFYISDEQKDLEQLPDDVSAFIKNLFIKYDVDCVLIFTEPSGRLMWLKFSQELGVNCYLDKPIFSFSDVMTKKNVSLDFSKKVFMVLDYAKENPGKIAIGLDRPIIGSLSNFLSENKDFYHQTMMIPHRITAEYSAGKLQTAKEILLESNHPFTKGYGVVFHTGFHIFDYVARLVPGFGKDVTKIRCIANLISASDYLKNFINTKFNQVINDKKYSIDGLANGEAVWNGFFELTFNSQARLIINISLNSFGLSARNINENAVDPFWDFGRVKQETYYIDYGPFGRKEHSVFSPKVKRAEINSRFKEDYISMENKMLNGELGISLIETNKKGPVLEGPLELFLKKSKEVIFLEETLFSHQLFCAGVVASAHHESVTIEL